ncbi:MAG: hypothetical protein RLZZ609_2990, partial [Cyanobacteriota bacterium]
MIRLMVANVIDPTLQFLGSFLFH